jgi:hypothetical protein
MGKGYSAFRRRGLYLAEDAIVPRYQGTQDDRAGTTAGVRAVGPHAMLAGVFDRGTQVAGGGAKKQRRVPSGRLQRQKAPSGEGCASLNGIFSTPKIR